MKLLAVVTLSLLVFGCRMEGAPKKQRQERPNILFIEVDDLNYEYVSFNGSKVNQTPNVDALAKSGVFFKNAVAQGMMCGPSRNSLMTGLYPHNLGFYQNGQMRALPKGVWAFPKALQKADYYTAWIGKCHIRPGGKDKTRAMETKMGFDYVRQTLGRVVLQKKVKQGKVTDEDWYIHYLDSIGKLDVFKNEIGKLSTLKEDEYLDGFFTHSALQFLDKYSEKKPFFLWLNYSLPHDPADVPEEYHTFSKDDMPGPTTIKNYTEPKDLVKKTKYVDNEDVVKDHQAGFCANISFMDKQVERVVSELKKRGLYENTIIVFFSDQGLMMGDHKRFHKGTLFRQITNPLLVVSWPAKFEKDIVIENPVELDDLINTVLEVANAPEKELQVREQSISLLPALEHGKPTGRKVAFAEIEGYVMATDGKYRLIKGKDATLLFDDVKDPKNLVNIASGHPDVVKRLSADIDEWFKETGKPLPPKTY